MKAVFDVKNRPKENDLLIYDGTQFKTISKDSLLFELKSENEKLKNEIVKLKNDIDIFKLGVNEKLKDYHNILQTLTKEE